MRHQIAIVILLTLAAASAGGLPGVPGESLTSIPLKQLVWDAGAQEHVALSGNLTGAWEWLSGPQPAAAWHVSFAGAAGTGLQSCHHYRLVTDFARWLPLSDRYPQRIELVRSVFLCDDSAAPCTVPYIVLRMHVLITVAAPVGPAREVVEVKVDISQP